MYDADGKDDISALKSVLPVMSRHATGYHPISYTVWYEYTKGTNKALKLDVDAELQHWERLTATQTYSIYLKHLVDPAERAVMSARTGLVDLVAEVKGNVSDAERKAVGFDSQLVKFQTGLASAKTLEDVQGNVTTMLAETKKVSELLGRVATQLEQSKKEAQRLVDELKNMREEALVDTLSGLFNRRGFDLELQRLTARTGKDDSLALLMLDIDLFKNLNDTYGHPFGDAVIGIVGQFIQNCVGAAGIAARYGGEEFAVLLPNCGTADAEKMGQTIRLRVENGKIKRRKDDEAIGGITISGGIAFWKSGEDPASVVDRADKALYAAKHAGRNRIVLA